jgi:hypothetical protein
MSVIYFILIIILIRLIIKLLIKLLKVLTHNIESKTDILKQKIEEKRKEEEQRMQDFERHQKAYHQKMINLVGTLNEKAKLVNEYYYKILDTIPCASDALKKAEEEFNGGYFAPFWDQIEIATNELVAYNNYLQKINYCIDQYWDILKKIDDKYTEKVSACVLPGKLPDIQSLVDSLSKLVRRSQRDIDFSTIYEQRKTNTLLYHGFLNLGDAIYSLGNRITESINELSYNLNSSLDELVSATNENSRIVSDNILEQTDRINEHAKDQRRYESDSLRKLSEQQKTLEQQKRVLDSQNRRINNIQRGRKPGLFDE